MTIKIPSNAGDLPTGFSSNFPDSTKIHLEGYRSGPGLHYSLEDKLPTDTGPIKAVNFDTLEEVEIKFSTTGYNASIARLTFIKAHYNEDFEGDTRFSLFAQDYWSDTLSLMHWHCANFLNKEDLRT